MILSQSPILNFNNNHYSVLNNINFNAFKVSFKMFKSAALCRDFTIFINLSSRGSHNARQNSICVCTYQLGTNLSCSSCQPGGGHSNQALKYRTILWCSSLARAFTSRITRSRDSCLMTVTTDMSPDFLAMIPTLSTEQT